MWQAGAGLLPGSAAHHASPGNQQSAGPSPQSARGTLPAACAHTPRTQPAGGGQEGRGAAGRAQGTVRSRQVGRTMASATTGMSSMILHAAQQLASPGGSGLTSALGSRAARRRELAAGTSTSLLPCTMSTRMPQRRTTAASRSACVRWPSPCGAGKAQTRARTET